MNPADQAQAREVGVRCTQGMLLRLDRGHRLTRAELKRLTGAIHDSINPPPPTTVVPVYDVANLILCIPQAAAGFREPWRARLDLPSRSNLISPSAAERTKRT